MKDFFALNEIEIQDLQYLLANREFLDIAPLQAINSPSCDGCSGNCMGTCSGSCDVGCGGACSGTCEGQKK